MREGNGKESRNKKEEFIHTLTTAITTASKEVRKGARKGDNEREPVKKKRKQGKVERNLGKKRSSQICGRD